MCVCVCVCNGSGIASSAEVIWKFARILSPTHVKSEAQLQGLKESTRVLSFVYIIQT